MCPASTKSRIEILRDRSAMFAKARRFFYERDLVEVDCPLLTRQASVDVHIDLIPAYFKKNERRYLHSSPEYGMKRLLAEGIGDCFQLSHVFRDGEVGARHNPEFTLVEWYRIGKAYDAFIAESLDFIRLFLGDLGHTFLSYQEAFIKYAQVDPFSASKDELCAILKREEIADFCTLQEEGRDALLNLILGTMIEPHLGNKCLVVLNQYPASQAALAKTAEVNGHQVALRFEIYYEGVELANGYEELSDASEQKKRLEEANHMRLALGKDSLPMDEAFLKALEAGLPSCCGVAVGFDRLMLLRHKVRHLSEILPFSWDKA